MHYVSNVKKSFCYNTKYFISIPEFTRNFNLNQSISICVKISSVNAKLNEFMLLLQNDSYYNNLGIMCLMKSDMIQQITFIIYPGIRFISFYYEKKPTRIMELLFSLKHI